MKRERDGTGLSRQDLRNIADALKLSNTLRDVRRIQTVGAKKRYIILKNESNGVKPIDMHDSLNCTLHVEMGKRGAQKIRAEICRTDKNRKRLVFLVKTYRHDM